MPKGYGYGKKKPLRRKPAKGGKKKCLYSRKILVPVKPEKSAGAVIMVNSTKMTCA